MNKVILIPLISLKNQKISEVITSRFEFCKNYVRCRLEFYAEEPTDFDDIKLPWKTVFHSIDVSAKKECISGVEKFYLDEEEKWRVLISIIGFSNDIKFYFTKESEADDFHRDVLKYLFNKNWRIFNL